MADEATPLNDIFSSGDTSPSTEQKPTEPESSTEEKASEESVEKTSESTEQKPTDDDKKKEGVTEEEKPGEKSEKKPDEKTADESFEKRWKDTVQWAQREQTARQQLEAQLQQQAKAIDILKKKVADPDYDPTTDPEHALPSTEDTARAALEVGKVVASRTAAYQLHGQEKVDGMLGEFHKVFNGNPMVQQAVREAESPVFRAMEILEDFQFRNKYGFTPKDVFENVKKEVLAEAKKTMRQEILDEIKAGGAKRDRTASGLSNVRGSNGQERKSQENTSPETPLTSMFPNN